MSSEYLVDVTLKKDYPIKKIKSFLSYVWKVSKDNVYCVHSSYFRLEQHRGGGEEIGSYMLLLEQLLQEKGFDIELIQAWSLHQDDADYNKWFDDVEVKIEHNPRALGDYHSKGGSDF